MPDLRSQRAMAARLLGCGRSRVRFEPARIADIEDAITAADVHALINSRVIFAVPKQGLSNARLKHKMMQKKRGRQKGKGSRKGSRRAGKRRWIVRIRAVRDELQKLKKEKRIDSKTYRSMYSISKSGFFRSRSHLLVHLDRSGMLKEAKESKK